MAPEREDLLSAAYRCLRGLPEQVEAVISASPLTVVSAGAGTGKTQTLSQRFAWLLASDRDLTTDRILVLTFTEKAAREMHDRIRETLVRWKEEGGRELSHLDDRLSRIDDAYISTIHSFAMKVIKESGLILNIDPAARIVTKPEEELWWKTFAEMTGDLSLGRIKSMLSEKWAARAEELFSERHFKDLVNHYGPERLAEISRNASEKLGSFGRTPDDLWEQSADELMSDIGSRRHVFGEIWETWQGTVFPAVRADLTENPGRCFARLKEIGCEFYEKEPDEEELRRFAILLIEEGLSDLQGCSRKIMGSISEALGEKLTEWRDRRRREVLMASPLREEELVLSRLLCRTSALGWQCWESERQRGSVLTNNDLIRYAGQVLKMDPDFGSRFSHILADEFQDTDGLQDELLNGLWKEGRNTLFIVGDIKQSIYRFRHANLKIFGRYISTAKDGDGGRTSYITLDKSFRTRDRLVEKINSIFGSVWSEGIEKSTGMEYEPLGSPSSEEWWIKRNGRPTVPEFEVIAARQERPFNEETQKYEKEESVYDARVRLYRGLAKKIREIHEAGTPIWDKRAEGEDKFRCARWNDFALLVPKRTFYDAIEEAFDSEGIPYVLCTRRDYFNRGETADLVNFISLLADPADPSYLAGWVASPLSGLQPGLASELMAEGLKVRKNKGPVPLSEIIREEYPEVYAYLEEMRRKAELRGVSALIRELLCTPDLLKSYEPDRRRRVRADISYMAEIAAEYESSQGRSLVGCAEYMRFAVKGSKQQEEPEITDEDHDAVNVMTIHSAKGLEYPVVALGGTEGVPKGPPAIDTSLRYGVTAKRIPEFLVGPSKKEVLTASWLWHSESESEALAEEEERFWYVAATRARDKLMICGLLKISGESGDEIPPPGESFLGMIREAENGDDGWVRCLPVEDGAARIPGRQASGILQDPARMLCPKAVSPAKLARLSASAYAMFSWCPAAYRIAYRQGRTMQWMARPGEGSGGSEFGSLAHWVLSKWDFSPGTLDEWLPEEKKYAESALKKVPYGVRGEFRSAASRNEIRRMLLGYAMSDEGRLLSLLASGKYHGKLSRETPFRVNDGDLLMVGSTDIFWEEGEHIDLRDWKTTSEEDAPAAYYEEQLRFYAYAMHVYRREKGLPEKTIRIGINYLRSPERERIRAEMSPEMISETGRDVHRAAVSALLDFFEARPERCPVCPWRDICSKKHI